MKKLREFRKKLGEKRLGLGNSSKMATTRYTSLNLSSSSSWGVVSPPAQPTFFVAYKYQVVSKDLLPEYNIVKIVPFNSASGISPIEFEIGEGLFLDQFLTNGVDELDALVNAKAEIARRLQVKIGWG